MPRSKPQRKPSVRKPPVQAQRKSDLPDIREVLDMAEEVGIDEELVEAGYTLLREMALDEDAINRAQKVIYKAWDARTPAQRIKLAHQALRISPLCTDAHVLRAQHAKPGSDDELEAWETALATGQLMLGEEAFENDVGMFWGLLETRPYMRACLGLAQALWQRDRREEAVEHLQAMLELNPGDNQGVRYLLANWLLALDRDSDLTKLLKAYAGEESPAMSFSAALGAFRRVGDTVASRKLLAKAIKANGHVPAFLLGDQAVPRTRAPWYSPGDANEAADYAIEGLDNWVRSPGALDWLRAHRGTAPTAGPIRGGGSGR